MRWLSNGELFVVAFVVIAVVSARWWPRLGALVAETIARSRRRDHDPHAD